MANIVLKDASGADVVYENVETVTLNDEDGGQVVYSLGGTGSSNVNPVDKTDDMTQPVGVDSDGLLWTAPSAEDNSSTITETVIFEQQTVSGFASNSEFGVYTKDFAFSTDVPFFDISIGDTCKVYWDDTWYEVVVQDGSTVMSDIIFLGNGTNWGLSGNDEPFVIAWDTVTCTFLSLTDELESHDIAIHKVVTDFNQPDWEQNDETANDYIKNRPFYVIEDEVKILTLDNAEFWYDGGMWVYDEETPVEQYAIWDSDWAECTVIWDGTSYTVTPQYIEGIKAIGNLIFAGGTSNGEPFYMAMFEDGYVIASLFDEAPEDTENPPTITHDVSISLFNEVVYPLNPKFIESVPWSKVSDKPFGTISAGTVIYEGTVNLFLQQTEDIYLTQLPMLGLTAGQYTVEWDGVSYDLETILDGVVVSLLNNSANIDEIFWIADNVDGLGVAAIMGAQGSHTLKISTAEEMIKQIDSKYLPTFGTYIDLQTLCCTSSWVSSTSSDIISNFYSAISSGSVNIDIYVKPDGASSTLINATVEGTLIDDVYWCEFPVCIDDVLYNVVLQSTDSSLQGKVMSSGGGSTDSVIPTVTTSDNGKFLRVVDGAWTAVTVENAEEASF